MLPEIWDAEKGTTTQKVTWEKEAGRTKVSLELESLQSLFVIFRKQTKDTGSGNSIDVSESIVSEIAGPWKVLFKPVKAQESFEVNMDSLYDWTISADKRLKYFPVLPHTRKRTSDKERNKRCPSCLPGFG